MGTTSAAETLAHGHPDDWAAVRVSELFERHGATVLGLCRVLLRNAHEAEDAAQQTFLAAYRSMLNGVEPRHPAAWLAAIARNECWSVIERRMREPAHGPDAESPLPDPVTAAAANADLQALWRAIGDLPHQQRQALLLREFSGLSYDELAVALGVSEPAVESLLFRARRELRTRLRPVFGSFAIAPLNAVRDALAPVAVKLGAGATAVVVAGGTVAAVESHMLLREVAVQPAVASALPDRARPVPAAPVPQAAPRGGGRTAVPYHRAPAPMRHSTEALRARAPVSDASAAPSAGGVGTPPVVTPPVEAPAAAPAAVPTAAPPEPPPSVGGDDSPGDDASPATGDDGTPGTSGSGDGGTSSGEGSGGADDHSGPGGGGDDSGGSSGPGEGGDSSGPGGGDDGGTSGSSGPGGGGDDAVSGGSGSSGSGSGGHGEPES